MWILHVAVHMTTCLTACTTCLTATSILLAHSDCLCIVLLCLVSSKSVCLCVPKSGVHACTRSAAAVVSGALQCSACLQAAQAPECLSCHVFDLLFLSVWISTQAGVHSGDSACSLPTQTIPSTTLNIIREWTYKVAKALSVVGLINIQYAIQVSGLIAQLITCANLLRWVLVLVGLHQGCRSMT